MAEDMAWLGAIYIKEEGGYAIILKSLWHYKKRLKTMGKSPELQGAAAMFSSVLRQQAVKTMPEIDATVQRICNGLAGKPDGNKGDAKDGTCAAYHMAKISDDIPLLEKALACYRSDICKAQDTGHDYFTSLVGGTESAADDIVEIDVALKKIKSFE